MHKYMYKIKSIKEKVPQIATLPNGLNQCLEKSQK